MRDIVMNDVEMFLFIISGIVLGVLAFLIFGKVWEWLPPRKPTGEYYDHEFH